MADVHSNFKTYSKDDIIAGYQNTTYKIRSQKQIFTVDDVNTTHSVVNTSIDSIKAQLDNIIDACSAAKTYCGTDSLSLKSDGSTERNQFPAKLDQLSSDASALKTKLESMKQSINEIATQAPGLDNAEYNKWLNAPENPKNQEKANSQLTSDAYHAQIQ